jgi:hypothetical protein
MQHGVVRVIALDPSRRGFAFAVLEGSERLVEWGVAALSSNEDREYLVRVSELFDRYPPDLLVLEGEKGSRRGLRARRRIRKAAALAGERKVSVLTPSRADVRRVFEASGTTKWEIAVAISRFFTELEPRLPRKRKPWMPEDERMGIFDAVSFALTALRDMGQ